MGGKPQRRSLDEEAVLDFCDDATPVGVSNGCWVQHQAHLWTFLNCTPREGALLAARSWLPAAGFCRRSHPVSRTDEGVLVLPALLVRTGRGSCLHLRQPGPRGRTHSLANLQGYDKACAWVAGCYTQADTRPRQLHVYRVKLSRMTLDSRDERFMTGRLDVGSLVGAYPIPPAPAARRRVKRLEASAIVETPGTALEDGPMMQMYRSQPGVFYPLVLAQLKPWWVMPASALTMSQPTAVARPAPPMASPAPAPPAASPAPAPAPAPPEMVSLTQAVMEASMQEPGGAPIGEPGGAWDQAPLSPLY